MSQKFLVTPFGLAKYPRLDKPFSFYQSVNKWKEDPNGFYTVSLVLTDNEETRNLLNTLDVMFERAISQQKVLKPQYNKKKINKIPIYSKETDDNNNETGNILIRFKNKAFTEIDGKIINFKPTVIDSDKNIITDVKKIGRDSKIRVKFKPSVNIIASGQEYNAYFTLRMKTIQVAKLEEFDEFEGLDAIDGGFVCKPTDTNGNNIPKIETDRVSIDDIKIETIDDDDLDAMLGAEFDQ